MEEKMPAIQCPGCKGYLGFTESTGRWAHVGPHDASCNWKSIEPLNHEVLVGYVQGKWSFDSEGNIQRTVEPPKPPISPQFENNVVKVDFKNRKKLD